MAYLALRAGRTLIGGSLEWRRGGRWLCVAMVAVAAGYQVTAVKSRWLARCHAPAVSPGATVATGLRSGWYAGLRCLASSWALMAALFALGAMSLVWMAVLAALIAAERIAPMSLWQRDDTLLSIRLVSAMLLIAIAAALAVSPGLIPGFTVPGSPAARHAMSRMGMPGSAMDRAPTPRRSSHSAMSMSH